jgi:uncharacterized 2Fe-2S/4Fe-4S cluster protein (DUF4445 family)
LVQTKGLMNKSLQETLRVSMFHSLRFFKERAVPWVTFINNNLRVEVAPGTSILEAARTAGLVLETPCGGMGRCGKCGVLIPRKEQLAHISGGADTAAGAETEPGRALACRTFIRGDLEVQIRDYAGENGSLQITAAGRGFSGQNSPYITKRRSGNSTEVYGGDRRLGIEAGSTAEHRYGAAIDLGTTTLVCSLIDLNTGKELAHCSALNPQTAYAQDVISRIFFCRTDQGLETLRRICIETLGGMISRMAGEAGIQPEHIYEAVYSGNTVMLHLACGLDPGPLGQYPYKSRIRGGNHTGAEGLGISPFGLVYIPPVVSAYVGADIVSGILVSRLDESRNTTVFIDVGTNGELVLARDGKLAAAAAAAGPAFEGMNIACGMRAHAGAVESFQIDAEGRPAFQVIGGGEARGICGSGLLDIAGELVRTGLIESSGRFAAPKNGGPRAAPPKGLGRKDGKSAYYITPTVYLTQQDVRQVQLAKGAIRAGIETLLAHFCISAADVQTVVIAGSFGYHLNEESLINTGLLPPEFGGKVRFAGNTSLSGAAAFLLNTGFRKKMEDLVPRVDAVDLSGDPDFEDRFIRYLDFEPPYPRAPELNRGLDESNHQKQ